MKKFPVRKILMALGALGLVALLVYSFLPKPVPVDMAKVERGTLLVTVDDDGKTRIKKWSYAFTNGAPYRKETFRYLVAAPVDGFMRQILLEPGDHVQAGSVISVLRPRVPTLLDARSLAEAVARKESAKVSLEHAVAQERKTQKKHDHYLTLYRRAQRLFPSAMSHEAYDNAKNDMQLAYEDFRVAKMAVKVATYELKTAAATLVHARSIEAGKSDERLFEITSPITGKVLKVHKEFRGPVTAGADLIEVGDVRELDVIIDILSEDAVKIKEGAKVFLEQWGGDAPLIGRVRRVEPGGFLKISALGVEEQRVYVIVDFDEAANAAGDPENYRRRLGDAYRVQARIVIWEGNDVVKVPAGALFRHQGRWAVYVVADGRAVLRSVEAGMSNGLETEIKDGLQVDETVILHPSDQIKDGVQVYAR